MDSFLLCVEIFGGATTVLSGFLVFFVWIRKLIEGQKCQLRQEMLKIYYKSYERKRIRQYQLENFTMMYKAYKALNGNSFIDIIYNEVIEWEIVP